MILGARYEANAAIAMEVVESALPYVDVLSLQDFRDPVAHLDEWHRQTGKPVLLAAAAGLGHRVPRRLRPQRRRVVCGCIGRAVRQPWLHRFGDYQEDLTSGALNRTWPYDRAPEASPLSAIRVW